MDISLALWRDRKGNLSVLRIVTLAVLLWPAVLAVFDTGRGGLGPRPLNEVIHRSGWWALVFLMASLAVTPLRQAGGFARLFEVRRMIGVASFCYAAAHLALYVVDQRLDLVKVATEIASRLYLTIGFVALLGLAALGATSNDAMLRRLGGLRWRRLHRLAYGIALLALVHFFQQTKADIAEPTLFAGLFAWMMGYRILARAGGNALAWPRLLLLALLAGGLTFAGDALGLWLTAGRPPPLDFLPLYAGAALDPDLGIRPGWPVLAAGIAVALLEAARSARRRLAPPRPRRPVAASAAS
ncbi:sulfite oxidase heme-binding subunit YedZ [Enterovirga aerilata]|uniref:Protein-methionine-sulfoxide reductase heme-binding subunit MsrQ n=1 Tax=Enterovirga aerilata TaxID=2730920 RepID=A0A849IFY6_9HYPH|nr:ferric reductase-like transmembrane domain-containing protein [Enterovirga sp. DB1703]NNM74867.1 sulfoxide reductase heme-binding subunit YedZ [Enterovirga sp. DB1703]